jgi:beta-aspartyl-peptidase (threonine type)
MLMPGDLHLDHGPVTWPAILVHGGAGAYEGLGASHVALIGSIEAAVDVGWAMLAGGAADPVAAVVAAVRFLEQDGGFNAGRGSVPATDGTIEMDAAVMDQTGRAGAVACVTRHSPVLAAKAVFSLGGPVLLAGPNADYFAASRGVPVIEPVHERRESGADPPPLVGPLSTEGTVGAVAVSGDGSFAVATSTGGRPGQLPGRVGDTPIPGAGLWAEPGCALAATGAGEAFLLAGFSRLAVARHLAGEPLPDALTAGLEAVKQYGGQGGGIALGRDRTWAAAFNTRAMARGLCHGGGRRASVL